MSTGTRFLLAFFESNPEIPEHVGLAEMLKHGPKPGLNLVHAHYGHAQLPVIKAMAVGAYTVVSLRDPLLSVIKGKRNNKHFDMPQRMRNYLDMVELCETFDPHVLPVDLLAEASVEDRLTALTTVSGGYVSSEVCQAWAEEWPAHNSAGDYILKRMYYKGDIDSMVKEFKDSEWQALIEHKFILRPFLERYGYRDLLWW